MYENEIDRAQEIIALFDRFIELMPERFERRTFKRIRQASFSQWEWGACAGVSQGTIGNWERGITSPQGGYRKALLLAAEELRGDYQAINASRLARPDTLFDPLKTTQQLEKSILRAALTDFELDKNGLQIVPTPFASDQYSPDIEQLADDKSNLLSALREQAQTIIEELNRSTNVANEKLKRYIEKYRDAASCPIPNPRLLNSYGQTIARAVNEESFSASVNTLDGEALNSFNKDHLDLMRLYFREALGRAQEIDAASLVSELEVDDGTQFREIADLMEEARSNEGEPLVSRDISTILRDISREMSELSEAELLTIDPTRKGVLERRKGEAFKIGSVYVGRFVFFAALISAVSSPATVGYVGSLASIIGLIEAASPGTVRSKYDRLRQAFPILPRLPEVSKNGTDVSKKPKK